MPYMGEDAPVLFETFLLGAFPLFGESQVVSEQTGIFEMEWIVPAELSSCLAHTDGRLCSIYEDRPICCRNFPKVGSSNNLHDFCPYKESFSDNLFIRPDFVKKAAVLEAYLMHELKRGDKSVLNVLLGEDCLSKMPLLYNAIWCLLLTISSVPLRSAIMGQTILLETLKEKGLRELTVIIPRSDYCITGSIEGLQVNLEYLLLRIEKQGLETMFQTILKDMSLI